MKRTNKNKEKQKGRMKKLWVISLGAIFITSFTVNYLIMSRNTNKSDKLEAKAKEEKESNPEKEEVIIEPSKEETKKEKEEAVKQEFSENKEVPKVVPQVVPTVKPVEKPKPIDKPKICGFQGCKLEVGHKPGHEDPVQNWCTYEGCDLLEGQDGHTHDSVVEPPVDSDENDCEYPECNLPQDHMPKHEVENFGDVENDNN